MVELNRQPDSQATEPTTEAGPLSDDELATVATFVSSLNDDGILANLKVAFCSRNDCTDGTSIDALEEAIEDLQTTCEVDNNGNVKAIDDVYDAAPSLALVVSAANRCFGSTVFDWRPSQDVVDRCLKEFFSRVQADVRAANT